MTSRRHALLVEAAAMSSAALQRGASTNPNTLRGKVLKLGVLRTEGEDMTRRRGPGMAGRRGGERMSGVRGRCAAAAAATAAAARCEV